MRFKNRYLLAEVVWDDGRVDETLSTNSLYHAIRDALVKHFGDWGLACVLQSFQGTPHLLMFASLHFALTPGYLHVCVVKYFNHLTNLCIIRSGRDHHQMVV
jgi:hypothetical protein